MIWRAIFETQEVCLARGRITVEMLQLELWFELQIGVV